jgi:YD repeat-containing protein
MKTIIRKILREQFEYREQLFNLLKTGDSDNIEMVKMISQGQDIDVIELLIGFFKEDNPPYFKILNHFDLSDDELIYIFSEIFGEPVTYDNNEIIKAYRLFNQNGKIIYRENYDGWWGKFKYNEIGYLISWEDADGKIEKNL